MGFLSDTWSDVKKGVSTGWESVKDEVKDVTGIQSMNDMLFPGLGVASGMAALQGRGWLGEQIQGLHGQPMQPPGAGVGATGPLTQNAPAGLTMGGGGPVQAQTVAPGGGVAGLFGDSGYQYGGSPSTSSALLQYNPEAYQYRPLMDGVT